MALGGEAGARLAAELGLLTSPDTLLRLIRAATSTPTPTPRVLGVDDWAIRKRQLYGTILYDLERHRPVDLLLGRTPEILASWLKSHPGVEVVSRDRAGAYAEGVTRGAPSAVQVADRWHLLRNLQEAVEGCCVQHHAAFRQPEPEPPPIIDEPPLPPRLSPKHEADLEARRARRQARFDEVWRLNRAGASRRQIGRQVGLSVLTVRKYLAMADGLPQTLRRRSAATLLDPYRDYLRVRWQEGCHSAPRLLAELRVRGYAGGLTTVKDGLLQMRRRVGTPHRPRSPREVAWLLIKRTELLRPDEQSRLQAILEHDGQIHRLYALAQEFCSLVRLRRADLLDDWMARARASPMRQMRAFAAGLERDLAAVRAGLSLPWSQGPVEGAIHRLKLIKRQTYGRGSIAHLRTRLLASA